MSNPASFSPAPRWLLWLSLLGLLWYELFLAAHFSPVAAGSDASGYLNSARLLTEGRLAMRARAIPELQIASTYHVMPLGFIGENRPGYIRLAPTYPVGLPLLLALAKGLTNWQLAPFFVCIGSALAGVWLCYLVGRELGLSPLLAAIGAAALGLSPMFMFIAVQPLSDGLATTWCLLAVYMALRARRGPAWWAAGCGVAFAVAVLVRPSDIVLLPALVLSLGHWRRLLWCGLGGVPGALWLAYYQHKLYGDAFRSGYGDIFGCFHSSNFAPTMRHFAFWLACLLPAVLLILPLGALRQWRRRWRDLAALGLWAAAFIGFYAYYDVSQEVWWCLRFILPAFPPLILAGLLGLEDLCSALPDRFAARGRTVAAAVLALWVVAGSAYWTKSLAAVDGQSGEHAYAEVCDWSAANLPSNSVVACMATSGTFYFYTNFPILRWDQIELAQYRTYSTALLQARRPLYAVLFPFEQEPALKERMPGRWEKIVTIHDVGIWKLPSAPP